MSERRAVIGIGSNSVRLLVADVEDGRMRVCARTREGTRLFAGLDANGYLSGESMARTAAAAARFAAQARALHAARVALFATSAARDARNQAELSALLRETSGLSVDIVSGEREARLSYRGAAGAGAAGLIDIGGGSTEYIVGDQGAPLRAVSLQMGAVRLHGLCPVSSSDDARRALDIARRMLDAGIAPIAAAPPPPRWVGVGGTLTTLADICAPGAAEGYPAAPGVVEEWLFRLADMPLAERARVPGLPAQRVDIFPCGLAILLCAMRRLAIDRIDVTGRGNLDGYLLDM